MRGSWMWFINFDKSIVWNANNKGRWVWFTDCDKITCNYKMLAIGVAGCGLEENYYFTTFGCI